MQLIARAVVLALPVTAALAHRGQAHHDMAAKRQAATATTSVSHAATTATSTPAASTPVATKPPVATTSAPTVTTPAAPVNPGVTAPGAVPLANIVPVSVLSDTTTVPLPATTAGAKPSGLPNAPALPPRESFFLIYH